MKSKSEARSPLNDYRSRAVSLLTASGLRTELASHVADSLLWFDSAGMSSLGIASLPDLLDRISKMEIDPEAEPKIGPERASAAVLDGRNGPPYLVLARAAEIASEKAREYGSGLIRVKGIGPIGSAAMAVFEIAIGPAVGIAVGPNGAWSIALPSETGLPLIADSAIGSDPSALAAFAPWSPLLGLGEWIVQAVLVPALEPLMNFHARVSEFAKSAPDTILTPLRLEELRREARESGVTLSKPTQTALKKWGERLGVS